MCFEQLKRATAPMANIIVLLIVISMVKSNHKILLCCAMHKIAITPFTLSSNCADRQQYLCHMYTHVFIFHYVCYAMKPQRTARATNGHV